MDHFTRKQATPKMDLHHRNVLKHPARFAGPRMPAAQNEDVAATVVASRHEPRMRGAELALVRLTNPAHRATTLLICLTRMPGIDSSGELGFNSPASRNLPLLPRHPLLLQPRPCRVQRVLLRKDPLPDRLKRLEHRLCQIGVL